MSCPFASLCLFLLYAAVSCYQCSASWKDASINRLTMCYFCSNSHFKDLCLKRLDLFILNVCLFALVWSYVCLFAPLFGWIEWTTFCPLYWARNYLTFVLPHFASFIFWRRFWSFARFQFFFFNFHYFRVIALWEIFLARSTKLYKSRAITGTTSWCVY